MTQKGILCIKAVSSLSGAYDWYS